MANKKPAFTSPYFSGFCGEHASLSQHGHCRHVFPPVGVTPEIVCACDCHAVEPPSTFADPTPDDAAIVEPPPTFGDSDDWMVEARLAASIERLEARWAALWVDVHGNRHVDAGYGSEAAAAGHIESLMTHGVLDVEQDMDVRSYEGEVPSW